jgi:transposase
MENVKTGCARAWRSSGGKTVVRTAMSQYGAPIPDGYDREDWPYKWCSFDEARGFVTRIRAEGSGEAKAIAEEYGVSRSSIKRAVRQYLVATQQYEPAEWLRFQRRRKAEARQRFLERMAERDRKRAEDNALIAQGRATLSAERALDQDGGPLHIASSSTDEDTRQQRMREAQRRLHAKNRARAAH